MDTKELLGYGITLLGVAFGFGRQATHISVLRRDINMIGESHRSISNQLSVINDRLARIEQDLSYIKKI